MFTLKRASVIGYFLILVSIAAGQANEAISLLQPSASNVVIPSDSSTEIPATTLSDLTDSMSMSLASSYVEETASILPSNTQELITIEPTTLSTDTANVTTSSINTNSWDGAFDIAPSSTVVEASQGFSIDAVAIAPSSTVAEASQSVSNDTSTKEDGSPETQPASGQDAQEGELSTGGKVAIGIFVSLAIVGLIVGGVCFYQRTNDPKGTLKNLVNPGIQYRSFDTTGGKEVESTVSMR
ncbi:mucin-5AC [Biomphalaria pfeifferi]|uniref:Mucin-5AC n=1 Tax=Biomphalaria pfeifferi TaxID=112525 RepID=A0AAD8AVD4_BIOPF|nr:mucin-5AC [Biomphalaria pfeifferi]